MIPLTSNPSTVFFTGKGKMVLDVFGTSSTATPADGRRLKSFLANFSAWPLPIEDSISQVLHSS